MWENFRYFLHRVLPVAEAANVKPALHPDDPPMSPVLGLARIMRSMDAFERVLDEADSPSNGITFCQGNFAAMGNVDLPAAIRRFGARKKLFFSHFRDVCGSVPAFEETFHDEGKTNMAECMRAYADIGYDGPMRPDHAPTMEGEFERHSRLYGARPDLRRRLHEGFDRRDPAGREPGADMTTPWKAIARAFRRILCRPMLGMTRLAQGADRLTDIPARYRARPR